MLGIEAIKNLQIKVPEQLAVLCFDDNDIFRLYTPTHFGYPPADRSDRTAGDVYLDRTIEAQRSGGGARNLPLKLPAELVPRQSI